jgi:hypothetical protein
VSNQEEQETPACPLNRSHYLPSLFPMHYAIVDHDMKRVKEDLAGF